MNTKWLWAMVVIASLVIGVGCFGNRAPAKPGTPVGPDERAIGAEGEYIARTTDPDGDSISYQFNWGTAGDTSVWTAFVPSGDSVLVTKIWNTAGTYPVTVRAMDSKGKISEWSNALTVTVRTNQAPSKPPIPTGPISGVVNRTYYFYATATDPDGDMVQFRFCWGEGDTSNWGNFVASGAQDSAAHTWTSGGLKPISVQARDKLGSTSLWSEPLIFVLTDTVYPYTIALTWNEDPRDLDAHIWTPAVEGDSYHIYFGSKGALSVAPYCSLDVDDVTSYGPEHITIKRAFPGEYIYAVHHWAGDSTITTSGAVVRVYTSGNLTRTFNVPRIASEEGYWWHVFKLNAVTGDITAIDSIAPVPPLPWSMDEHK